MMSSNKSDNFNCMFFLKKTIVFFVCLVFLVGCASASGPRRGYSRTADKQYVTTKKSSKKAKKKAEIGTKITGVASYYGPGFDGRKTASGEIFDQTKLTCAHKTLPFGTKLKVTRKNNGKSVVVRVNDRGPYAKGRVLDVSTAAAKKLGMLKAGHAEVVAEVIE